MEGYIGKTVGKYLIESEIGRGGMGVVYKGHQLTLNRTVAIKVLPPQMALDPDFLLRFQQEAQIIASLAHENIVYVYDIEESEGAYFIIMEYVEGQNLRKIVRHRRFSIEEVRSVGVAVSRALDYAHQKGIVHRDVKSHNVMITTDGKVKLMDFGIARVVGSGIKTQTGAVLGTPEYMSPEQARSGQVTPQTDIYAMGVVLYELATGQVPFRGGDAFAIAFKHISEPPPPPSSVDPNVPPWLEAIILKALQKEPSDRYASAGEMERELIRADSPVGASSVTRYDAPVAVPASLVDQALPMGIGATPTPPSRPSLYTHPVPGGTPIPAGTLPVAHPPIYPPPEPHVVPLWAKIVVGGAFGILLGLIIYLFLPRTPQAPVTGRSVSSETGVSTDSLLGSPADLDSSGANNLEESVLESSVPDPLGPEETIEEKWGNLEEEQKDAQVEEYSADKERPPYPAPVIETNDPEPYSLQPLEDHKTFEEPIQSSPPPPPPQPRVQLDETFSCVEAAEFHVDPEDTLLYVGGSLLGKADDWDGMGGGQPWEPGFGTYTVRLELEDYQTKWIRIVFSEDGEEDECDIDTELHEP